jgi:CheY-like chemotaxis protein
VSGGADGAPGAGAAPGRARGAALRVLVVDDDEVDRLIVRRGLARGGVAAEVDEAHTATDALRLVAEREYDCVFLDYNIPGGDGLTLLRGIRGAGLEAPVVMLTGQGDERVAVALMKAGAADYLPKASLTPERLAQSARHAVDLARAAAATRRAEAERRASAERMARLQDVTARLAAALSTADVAALFVSEVRLAVGADSAWIATLAADGGALRALASTGFPADAMRAYDRVPVDAPLAVTAALRDGRPRYYAARAEAAGEYPALAEALGALDQEATAVLPLAAGGRPFGAMTLGFRAVRPFPGEDREFVLALARQCAQALERARLYEAERASRAAAERLAARLAGAAQAITRQPTLAGVLREITEQARAIVGAHQAVTSLAAGEGRAQAIDAVSLSDKYAAWRGEAAAPDRPGLPREVAPVHAPMRLTQPELERHPAWRGAGAARDGARRCAAGWRRRSSRRTARTSASSSSPTGRRGVHRGRRVDPRAARRDGRGGGGERAAARPRRGGAGEAEEANGRSSSSSPACRTTCARRSTPSAATRSSSSSRCTGP